MLLLIIIYSTHNSGLLLGRHIMDTSAYLLLYEMKFASEILLNNMNLNWLLS